VKIESIDVAETIKTTKALIETEASLSLDLKEALDQLLYVTTITIAPDAEGEVGASKNGKNGAKTCQAFILFFSGTLCC
jgi:hypothetical protein